MVKINFGISSYSRFSPGVPWEERIMEIPESGKLPDIPDTLGKMRYLSQSHSENIRKFNLCNYSDVRKDIYTELPAVGFELAGEHSHDTYEMYLIWLEQRNEWVAVPHEEWSEIDFSIDESEFGAYALDDYCRNMLSRVYAVDKEKLHGDVSKMSPSELERLAL